MKKWFTISFLVIMAISLAVTVVLKVNEVQENEVLSGLDNSLKDFYTSQDIAVKFISYLSVRTPQGYRELREEMKPLMRESIFNQYFYSEEYPLAYRNSSVELVSTSGSMVDGDNVFKLNVVVKTNSYEYNYVYFVTIKNMMITKIERI